MFELIIFLGVIYLVAALVVAAGLTIGRPFLTRMLTAHYDRVVEREQGNRPDGPQPITAPKARKS